MRRKPKRRPVFDKLDNIYRPKPYKPKKMSSQDSLQYAGPNLNLALICRDCKEDPPNLIEEFASGDMVCASCGLVLGERIVDSRSEWRTFANDDQGNDDPSRVGDAANPLLDGSQLTTNIALNDNLKGSKAANNLLRAANKHSGEKNDKALMAAYRDINAYCERIKIPKSISDSAKLIYKTVFDGKVLKGKSTEALVASSIFIACRQAKVPRTFREIYALTNVTKKEIGRTFKLVENYLRTTNQREAMSSKNGKFSKGSIILSPVINRLSQGGQVPTYQATDATCAKDLCTRFCSQLGLNEQKFIRTSIGLCEKVSSIGDLAGRSPLSLAAASVYMTSYLLGRAKSAKEVAGVCGVSDGTVRTAYKFLYQDRERLIEPSWIANGKGKMENLPVA